MVFDAGLAVLLVVTIGYCSRLSRRIRVLQDSRSELAGMITQFDHATARAMTSLGELQGVSKRITEALQLKIDKANFLADDLAFLIEKSTKLAAQLEQAKAATQPKPRTAEPPPYIPAAASAGLQPQQPPKSPVSFYPPAQKPELPSSARSAASLEALLSRLALPTGSIPPTAPKPQQPSARPQPSGPRTDAERELLEALKGR